LDDLDSRVHASVDICLFVLKQRLAAAEAEVTRLREQGPWSGSVAERLLRAKLAAAEAHQFSVGAKHLRDYADRVQERDEALANYAAAASSYAGICRTLDESGCRSQQLESRLAAAEARCAELAETNANNVACYQMQLEGIDKERGDKYLSAECRTHGCQVHRLIAEVERMKRLAAEGRD